ncbi:MAG: NUDIX domain-containing protein [Nocardioidaceae bacterium]|nr:NUDIX domain-containing protein [Nocardioidaceae bacterium]
MPSVGDFHLVGYLILQRADRVLLARRHGVSYADGHWGLPGGHVEPGETFAQAAARETWEEVGVRVDPVELMPVGMCRYVDAGVSGLDVYFTAVSFEGEPEPVAECDRVAWCRPDELPAPVVPWLPAALRRHLDERVWFNEMIDG